MRIQTFETTTNEAVVAMSGFLQEYQSNIRNAIIPPSQLPIYLTNYSARALGNGRVEYTTVALAPTNEYSRRIWKIELRGSIGEDVDSIPYEFRFGNDPSVVVIGFEGFLSGTFIVNEKVLDASLYWTYLYSGDNRTLFLQFVNRPEDPITVNTTFDLNISIPNIVVSSCRSGTVPYPPDNVRNVYCVHNEDATGAFGGFAVSGDVAYTDYGQNFLLTPTFLGSRFKLLFTLTKLPTAQQQVGTFMGSIFDIQYVGGPMSQNAYITFENKTDERVCVWVNPTFLNISDTGGGSEPPSRSFVDPGRNVVAYTIPLSNVFRWFDGQFDPCQPINPPSS